MIGAALSSSSGQEGVVPVWMRFVALELELLDVLFRHFDTCVISVCIQDGLNFQSATGTSTANEVHDGFKVDQGLAFPVQADEGK